MAQSPFDGSPPQLGHTRPVASAVERKTRLHLLPVDPGAIEIAGPAWPGYKSASRGAGETPVGLEAPRPSRRQRSAQRRVPVASKARMPHIPGQQRPEETVCEYRRVARRRSPGAAAGWAARHANDRRVPGPAARARRRRLRRCNRRLRPGRLHFERRVAVLDGGGQGKAEGPPPRCRGAQSAGAGDLHDRPLSACDPSIRLGR